MGFAYVSLKWHNTTTSKLKTPTINKIHQQYKSVRKFSFILFFVSNLGISFINFTLLRIYYVYTLCIHKQFNTGILYRLFACQESKLASFIVKKCWKPYKYDMVMAFVAAALLQNTPSVPKLYMQMPFCSCFATIRDVVTCFIFRSISFSRSPLL